MLEKPSNQEKLCDQRLVPKSKDKAFTEAELNAAGKNGFRLLRASVLSRGFFYTQEFLVSQKPAAGTRARYSYRIIELKNRQESRKATAAACSAGYFPITANHRSGFPYDAYWIYFEKKTGPETPPQQVHTASAEETESKPSAGPEQSSPTVLAKDTPVEIELLTDVPSESPSTHTPVQFKVV